MQGSQVALHLQLRLLHAIALPQLHPHTDLTVGQSYGHTLRSRRRSVYGAEAYGPEECTLESSSLSAESLELCLRMSSASALKAGGDSAVRVSGSGTGRGRGEGILQKAVDSPFLQHNEAR